MPSGTSQRRSFNPTPVRGSVKYGKKGGCTAEILAALDLPSDCARSLAQFGNMGITASTWSTYSTASKMLKACQQETGTCMATPMTQKMTLVFIDWMARIRKLKASTINSYLAGVRQLHIVQGMDPPVLRTGLVKLVLKGIANRDGCEKRQSDMSGRLPMTKNVMLLFKQLIRSSKRDEEDKRLLWAVATMAFAGAFRISELLAKNEATFDPDFTLLGKNVTWDNRASSTVIIHVCLKCPKETKSAAATTVDIYGNGGPLCPAKAFFAWRKIRSRDPDMPMFRDRTGTPLTGAKMNRIMKELLDPYTDSRKGKFSTHSFRIGLASMLGSKGYTDEEIQIAGRWSSRAFEAYTKLTRTKRAVMGRAISRL